METGCNTKKKGGKKTSVSLSNMRLCYVMILGERKWKSVDVLLMFRASNPAGSGRCGNKISFSGYSRTTDSKMCFVCR